MKPASDQRPQTPMMRSQTVRAGAFCQGMSLLPEDMPWITGWESNPLLSHIVLKRGVRLVAPFFVAALFHLLIHLILPPLAAMIATPFTFAVFFFLAMAWHAATYPGSVRSLFDGNTLTTPLSAGDLLQAVVLPPWAIGFGMLTPLLVLDGLIAAVWHWQNDPVWIVLVLVSLWLRTVGMMVAQVLCNQLMASMAVATLRVGESLDDTLRRNMLVETPRHLLVTTWPFLLVLLALAMNYLFLNNAIPSALFFLPTLLLKREPTATVSWGSRPNARLNRLWQDYPNWSVFESERRS